MEATKELSPAEYRYRKVYHRVRYWLKHDDALAGVSNTVLMMLAEVDEMCCGLFQYAQTHPDDTRAAANWVSAVAKRTDLLKLISAGNEEE